MILGFGPVIAFFLAGLCGFEASERTFQIILLVEVCLVTAGVGLLLLVQTLGPWTDREREDKEWLRLLNPQPGSMLADLAQHPDAWNRRLDSYLRSNWRDVATGRGVVAPVLNTPIENIRASRPPVYNSPPSPTPAPTPAAASTPPVTPPNPPAGVRRRPPGRPPQR